MKEDSLPHSSGSRLSQENMDEVCSLQLLTSVRRMVLTLTQQNDESKMFVRFFHKQLGGILQVWPEFQREKLLLL